MTDPAVFLDRISRLSPKRLALLALELQTRVEALERQAPEPIAIVGMGCRLPGDVDGPAAFWELLRGGVDAIREIPADRWDADALFDPDPAAPGKIATRWGGLLDGIDRFDPQVFGISPREAVSMDPQQRLLLEVSWEALEHAGYAPDRLAESPTGVFVGICNGDYYDLLMDTAPDAVDAYAATGSAHSVASGRLSYVLGLRGPSLSVDTACSSSLVAVHLAVQSLQAGECRVALAGGVNAILSPRTTMALSRAQMMAADGRCKTFDARADGFVRSEGCGVVVLKRLSEAQADGDRILALIRGSAVNQDGRSNGLTAPNGPSQVAVIRAALSNAGVDPADVSYVETHGTGTSLGDPIEVQALGAAYAPGRPASEPLLLGSVKTNLGHLESAAGITGMIKTVLMLQTASVPPHLHFETPNPHIPWSELAVKVPTELVAWAPASGKRLAGVSSFGFSGTNAHVILEAAPTDAAAPEQQPRERTGKHPEERAEILALSARDESALRALAGRYADSLRAMSDVPVAEVGYAAAVGRARFSRRLGVVASERSAMADALAAVAVGGAPSDLAEITMGSARSRPRVAMLFTGHGSLYRGAGHDVFETEPVFRAALERCASIAAGELSLPLLAALYPEDYPAVPQAAGLLDTMTYAQPALFALQYALATLWQAWGITPSAVAGHSGGEYAAACVAGSLSLEDALGLTLARGRLMDSLPPDGQMATVLASIDTVRELLASAGQEGQGQGEVVVAAINGPSNVAISGTRGAVENVVGKCAGRGIETRALNIPLAAHSPQVEPILPAFERAAAAIGPKPPRVTLVSTLTGRPAVAGEFGSASYWREHLRAPVRFAAAMQSLHEQGCEIFVEIGPRATLLGMGRASLPDNGAAATWLPSLRPDRPGRAQLLEAVAGLFCAGHDVEWSAVTGVSPRAPRPVLPTYPFQREVYWPEPQSQAVIVAPTTLAPPMPVQPAIGHPLLGRLLSTPALASSQVVYATQLGARWPEWLAEHRVYGASLMPAPGYIEMVRAAAAESLGWGAATISGLQIVEPLIVPDGGTRAIQLVLDTAQAATGTASFAVYSSQVQADGNHSSVWTLHANGMLESHAATAAPVPLDKESLTVRLVEHIDGARLYEGMASAGVELGPTFRGLMHAWRVDGEVLAQIRAPAAIAQARGYAWHPALLDACFHALGAALPTVAAEAGYLLVGCESLAVWGPPTDLLWSHTTLRTPTTSTAPQVLQADIEVYDADGTPVASVGGVLLKRMQRTAAMREASRRAGCTSPPGSTSLERRLPRGLSGAIWRRLEQTGQWLIVADDPAAGAELAAAIRKLGGACNLALATAALSCVAEDTWTVNPRAANEVRDLIAAMPVTRRVDLLRVVYLAGGEDPNSALGAARMLDSARVLLQATLESVVDTRLWLVTCDSQVDGHDPAAASLWGFGRVAALEQPARWGGLVDWTRAQPAPVAMSRVADEIARAGDEDQIALRTDDRRLVARLVAADVPPTSSDHGVSFDPSASYLVTGGLGGLGLKLAAWLVERGARHLVLVGRTPLPERDQWPSLEAGAPASARVTAILALEAGGARVTSLTLDVADRAAVRNLVSRFGDDLPPLRGIFHLAADLSSAPLAELSASTLQAMLRPKVEGAWVLDELTRELALDYFVLFSSTAALWGAQHLGHYAAANSFLDALAHLRRARGLPALAIDWGTWSEMRATTAAQRESYQQFGLQPMPSELALGAMGDALVRPNLAEVAIAAVDWRRLKPAYEARRVRPFLALMDNTRDHAVAALEAPMPHPCLVTELAAIEDLDSRRRVVFSYVLAEVARTLRIGRPEKIDPDAGLFDLGIDSLMAAELTTKLERAVAQPLPSTLVFNYSTVTAIVDFLAHDVLGTTAQASPAAPQSVEVHPSVAAGAAAESLDDLSEEELEASLAATLARLG